MTALSGFLAVVLSGLALIAEAVAIGGVLFVVVVLEPERRTGRLPDQVITRALRVITVGSFAIAITRAAALALVPAAFADSLADLPLHELMATLYARASVAHVVAACVLAFTARRIARRGLSRRSISALLLAGAAVLVSGAWLTHASSRIDTVDALMTVTLLHQLGAAAWVGGIAHLVLLRRPLRASDAAAELWPRLLARFSPLALGAVILLVSAGLFLAWQYVGDWEGLVGTGYGAMVVTKAVLLATALVLAALNYLGVRRWRLRGDRTTVEIRVPAYVEAELAIVITALLTAASLTSQPPARDVQTERASGAQVLAFLAPKKPTLTPPPRDELLATAASASDSFAVPTELERIQGNFNHNVAGLLVLIIGFAAALDRSGRVTFARHWPLLFLTLAAFLFLFAEPTVWPLGPESFWTTLIAPGVLQHRFATVLVIALAFAEWRVRVGALATTRWRFAFPLLCAAGGALLLTHSHSVFATRSEFLIEVSHAVLGLLALFVGVGRWLELRLPAPSSRAAGVLSAVCLIGVGLVLLFYREL